MRIFAPVTPVSFDQLPGSLEDGGIALSLPIFDIEGAIHLVDAPEPLHHQFGRLFPLRRPWAQRPITVHRAARS
jgi:hypothetical protein